MQFYFTHSMKNIHIPTQMSTCHRRECDSPCPMSRVLTDSLTHAYAKCENRHLCSINDHFSKTKAFCFINQNPLNKLQYLFVFTKSRVFFWVANFRGLTANFACLLTLSRTFIVGYMSNKEYQVFHPRGYLSLLVIPNTRIFHFLFL